MSITTKDISKTAKALLRRSRQTVLRPVFPVRDWLFGFVLGVTGFCVIVISSAAIYFGYRTVDIDSYYENGDRGVAYRAAAVEAAMTVQVARATTYTAIVDKKVIDAIPIDGEADESTATTTEAMSDVGTSTVARDTASTTNPVAPNTTPDTPTDEVSPEDAPIMLLP